MRSRTVDRQWPGLAALVDYAREGVTIVLALYPRMTSLEELQAGLKTVSSGERALVGPQLGVSG